MNRFGRLDRVGGGGKEPQNRWRPSPTCGPARNAAGCSAPTSTSATAGASAIAALSRSLAWLKRNRTSWSRLVIAVSTVRSAGTTGVAGGFQRANTALVASATPGLTSTRLERRQLEADRTELRRCRASAACADRDKPAHRRRWRGPPRRAAGRRRARPFARANSRSAAAASAEPPPRPAATGSLLSRSKVPSADGRQCATASARAALSTRLSAVAPACAALGPRTSSASSPPGEKAQAVADARRTRPGFRSRDSRRRGGRAPAASD